MARRHRCDSAPIGLGHFPVGSNRSGLMVLGARRCRGLHHEGLEAILRSNGSRAIRGLGLMSELGQKAVPTALKRHFRSTPEERTSTIPAWLIRSVLPIED